MVINIHIIRHLAWRLQEFLQGAGAEQVELQDTHKVLQSNIQVTEEIGVTGQKIDDEGRIDLAHHHVPGVADEGLDLQILLDPIHRRFRAFFNQLTAQNWLLHNFGLY
jgi:hypothetical protein